ncbi:YigZ family protein [Helicobacter mastomyrinus]|uniref:YigZ family protein n=2 Tax=Helicobacter TaxID=209 RepID=A0ABZ3F4X8_9HELI|nr:YigZ family protein [uncultured Helicobacter sp.]
MKMLLSQAQGSFESKGSKFLSFLTPFGEFDTLYKNLRQEHTKAAHFVRASRHLNEYQHIIESFDDDREPKGSSGIPSLNVLRGEELINVGVVVVRYFGGQLLGVGGLVRAYTAAVQNTIEMAQTQHLLQTFVMSESITLQIAYNQLSLCEYEAQKMGLKVYKDSFLANGVRLRIEGEKSALETLLAKRFMEDS